MDLIREHIIEPVDGAIVKLKSWKWRDALKQALNLATIVFSALMIWKSLMLITGSESPVVVVLSGSMEPTLYRGGILVLWMPEAITTGDITVFNVKGKDIPIIHRALDSWRRRRRQNINQR